VQSSSFCEVDRLSEQRTQGRHRHRCYAQRAKVQVSKLSYGIPGIFWAQRIITEPFGVLKRAFCEW
jgi:hypothetical protein